jgi:hypothetical protein
MIMKHLCVALLGLICITVSASLARADNDKSIDQIPIYSAPTDFETFRQLGIKNRVDRIDTLRLVINCFQQAKTVENIQTCMDKEKKTLQQLALAYCQTGVGVQRSTNNIPGAPSDCDVAKASLQGKLPRYQSAPPTTVATPPSK